MVGNIVSTAFEAAALRTEMAVREELIESQERRLELIGVRVDEGIEARATLVTARAQVEALRATLPPLRRQLALAEHRLAELVGDTPAQSAVPPIALAGLRLPRTVPITLPSTLVRRRPDILAAEAQLHAASAQIGVATANLYPDITLDASFGAQGFDVANMAPTLDFFLNLGARLLAPIFQGGRLTAQRAAAVAAYREALATYQGTVLEAFREVADRLRALENDALTLSSQAAALSSARESFDLAAFQFEDGAIGLIDVLVVEQSYQEARLAFVNAVAQRFQDTAALFAALGGGPLSEADIASVTTGDSIAATDAALDAQVPPSPLPRRQ